MPVSVMNQGAGISQSHSVICVRFIRGTGIEYYIVSHLGDWKHKTQVFLAPEGDHYRTRLTHTLEVAQIARSISRALRLNEDLTEAIALGHDLGHTPFGHAGERTLDKICPLGSAITGRA